MFYFDNNVAVYPDRKIIKTQAEKLGIDKSIVGFIETFFV